MRACAPRLRMPSRPRRLQILQPKSRRLSVVERKEDLRSDMRRTILSVHVEMFPKSLPCTSHHSPSCKCVSNAFPTTMRAGKSGGKWAGSSACDCSSVLAVFVYLVRFYFLNSLSALFRLHARLATVKPTQALIDTRACR